VFRLTLARFTSFYSITTWNPAAEGAAKIADMEEGGEKRYVCLEPGRVDGHHTLQPGQELLMQQVLRIE
jgi:glucose-6-phosphate 1-epimerase